MADLPENPNNREEEYLADLAGENGTKPANPWSRKEAYLDAIDGRMDGIEEQIAALATDISLKGSVASQADLPETAAVGDAYITEDTGVMYVYVGESGTEPWVALGGSGGGGDDAPLSLYVYRGKIGDGQWNNALYKDAALTTKVTVAEIHSKLKNGATVTLTTVSSPETVDYSWRGRLSLAYAMYPKECTDETMDETTISMYFSDPSGNSTSGKKYATAYTSWGPEYTDCWQLNAADY